MELLVWNGVVSADVVEARDASFAAQLVNEFTFPEQHDVLLVLGCFLLYRQERSRAERC